MSMTSSMNSDESSVTLVHPLPEASFALLGCAGLFLLALVMANLLGGVIVSFPKTQVGILHLPALQCSAGIFCFPLVFLLTDWIHQRWGKRAITTISMVGFILLILVALFFQALQWLPLREGPQAMLPKSWFMALCHSYSRAVIASVIAYAIGQACDIMLFRLIQRLMETQGSSYASIKTCLAKALGSTAVSQLLDTSCFFILFGWGSMPASLMLSLTLGDYLLKALASLASVPILAYLAKVQKKSLMVRRVV
ncbi:MAG: queuosine precursor transporter [Vampirovibrionales bacterium]